MEYSNKPVPNQSCRRFLKNILKNLSRTENFNSSQWRHLTYIPELLELGIVGCYYDLQTFIKSSNNKKINYARILIRLGRVAKRKNAFILINSCESLIRCGYCLYYHNNHQLCTYHQICSYNERGSVTYGDLLKCGVKIMEIQKIPFVRVKEMTIGDQKYFKPFVVN